MYFVVVSLQTTPADLNFFPNDTREGLYVSDKVKGDFFLGIIDKEN